MTDPIEQLERLAELQVTLNEDTLIDFACEDADFPAILAAYRQQQARIAELEAVVAKLPRTADGVPVVPGMAVWWSLRDDGDYCEWQVSHVQTDRLFLGSGVFPLANACYSTREAALAARESEVEK